MIDGQTLQARAIQWVAPLVSRVPRELRFLDVPARTTTLGIPTSLGLVRCTVYRPPSRPSPAPVYVNFHGGGFVLRHPEADDHICRYLAAHADCVVLNVDYDVAPQKPFPCAPTQAWEVTDWVVANGAGNGWDGSRLAVGGHSAGGNLAAGVCLTARDRGRFAPRLQILAYPPLDLAAEPETKFSPIARPLISARLAHIFNHAYLPELAARSHPLASPVLAFNLRGLAPALVITAEFDSLRDEGVRYAKALSAAGVRVTHRDFAGVDHSFTHNGPVQPATEAIELMAASLRSAFHS